MFSLTTIEYADGYMHTKNNADSWFQLENTDKNKYLFESTRNILGLLGFVMPSYVNHNITRPVTWHSLMQPWTNTENYYSENGVWQTPEPEVIVIQEAPDDIQQACCEVALALLTTGSENNPHTINRKLGITSISFGRDSVSYKDDNTAFTSLDYSIYSEYAQSILNRYIRKAYRYV